MQEIDKRELERWARDNFGIPDALDFSKREHRIALGRTLDRFVSLFPVFFAAWQKVDALPPQKADATTNVMLGVLREACGALETLGSLFEDERPAFLSAVEDEPRETVDERLRDWQRWARKVERVVKRYPTLEMDHMTEGKL